MTESARPKIAASLLKMLSYALMAIGLAAVAYCAALALGFVHHEQTITIGPISEKLVPEGVDEVDFRLSSMIEALPKDRTCIVSIDIDNAGKTSIKSSCSESQ